MQYEFKCTKGHYFTKDFKIGTCPKETQCPCGGKGSRAFSLPATPNTLGGMSYPDNKREYYG